MKLTQSLMLFLAAGFVLSQASAKSYLVSPQQVEVIKERLDLEAKNVKGLKNGPAISKVLQEVSNSIEAVEQGEDLKKKEKRLRRKIKVGKVASAITHYSTLPFLYVGSFIKGVVQNEEKHKKELFIERFFLANKKEFDDIAMNHNAQEIDLFIETMSTKFTDIYTEHYEVDAKEFLTEMMEIARTEGVRMITAERVNSTESFQKLKEVLGPINNETLAKWKTSIEAKVNNGELSQEAAIQIIGEEIIANDLDSVLEMFGHETVGAFVGQIIVAPVVLGIVSNVLALYSIPVFLIADLITYTNINACLKEESMSEDMLKFCGQVLNKRGYQALSVRAKAHSRGNALRRGFIKTFKIEKRKKAKGAAGI